MSAIPPLSGRGAISTPGKDGKPTFNWTLTSSSFTDTVKLTAGPFDVLPVIFVPGIMGSNLKVKGGTQPVWRLDTDWIGQPSGLARSLATKGPGARQKLLHPDRCEVDIGGAIPRAVGGTVHDASTYRDRGWGSVGEGPYQEFLLWLEEQLNPTVRNPALWSDYYQAEATISAPPEPGSQPKLFPGIKMGMKGEPFGAEKKPFNPIMTDDLIARSKFIFPVYAVGYNWLASNTAASKALQKRIDNIIKENDGGAYRCQQVVLVTHSMGGLVARACAQLPGMADKIAGISHGVMPAVGAAVAYRRCKVGMGDEDYLAGLVIGSDGQEVTAVFAQAPGALQLLPSQAYAPGWLNIADSAGKTAQSLPAPGKSGGFDPYANIYLRRDRWWGLVNEAWLSPQDGAPIKWNDFEFNIGLAQKFHSDLVAKFHPKTFAYYGADPKQKSFEKVTWRMKAGVAPDAHEPPGVNDVLGLSSGQIRTDGTNPEYVGGKTEVVTTFGDMGGSGSVYESSYWELHCQMQDGVGDGTVPSSSGSAPMAQGGTNVQQQFRLTGFGHEKSYRNDMARRATLFALTKIAGTAKRSV